MIYRFRHRFRRRFIRAIRFLARPGTYLIIFMLAVALTVAGAFVVWSLEETFNPGVHFSLDDAVAYMGQNVTGVSLGATNPTSGPTRVASIVIATLGAALRGVFVATVVSTFVNQIFLEGRGMGELNLKDHVVIAGWNPQVSQLVQVLEREAFGAGVPIALLCMLKENPLPNSTVYFLNGDPSSRPDLERASVDHARAVVVVSDVSAGPHSDSTLDARAVLTTLAVKSINPRVHVVAEVRDPVNRHHFKRANADEMIVTAEMGEGLLARSALNHGLAHVFSDLLRLDTPCEVYVVPTPGSLENRNFQEAMVHVYQERNAVLLGIIEGENVAISPPMSYVLHQGTSLVLVGNIK
jgi:voltage-gated potassium channel